MRIDVLWRGLPGHPLHPPLTGLADWLTIAWRSPLWWTATWHLFAMVSATVFFVLTAIVGHDDWQRGSIAALPFVFNLIGFGLLTLGGWLGGGRGLGPRHRRPH